MSEGGWALPEHLPIVLPHCVYDEVGVNVLGIGVSCDQHLAPRPRPLRKLRRQIVRRRPGDVLVRMEGLRVVVEVHRAFLAVHLPGGEELLHRELWGTVDAADQLAVTPQHLLLLLHIVAHTGEAAGGLTAVLDEIHRGHVTAAPFPPAR